MKLYKREKYLRKMRGFFHDDDIIKVITGVRRCGKSSLMQTIAAELKDGGVKEENIIYLDLDKRGNRSIRTPDKLEKRIDEQGTAKGLKYLFVDEIQNVRNFEELINGYRTDGDWSIFITGSNSYLLSSELMTKLTGRYLEFEMFPLTYEEYEHMKTFYKKERASDRLTELKNYIFDSGFPRAIFIDDPADKRTYVKGIINEIFDKDIRNRVKIRNIEAFESVRKYIINNFGATTSINNLYRALRTHGMNISRDTVTRYINALIEAKVLYECPRFDMKSKRSLHGEKKYYIADLGFYYAENTDNRIHFGPALENMVYIYAKSKDCSISVGRFGKLECDFITRNRDMNYAYIQVAYTILESEHTENREYKPLETIKDNYPRYVATTDTLLQKRSGIRHINIMDFMMEDKDF